MDTRSFDFVILGGGPAACSLALYAHKSNLRCLIIEKDSILGGLGRSWQWSNFIVDTGPHIFTLLILRLQDWCFYFDDLLVEGDYFQQTTFDNTTFMSTIHYLVTTYLKLHRIVLNFLDL